MSDFLDASCDNSKVLDSRVKRTAMEDLLLRLRTIENWLAQKI